MSLTIPSTKEKDALIELSVSEEKHNTFWIARECEEGMEVSGDELFNLLNDYKDRNF